MYDPLVRRRGRDLQPCAGHVGAIPLSDFRRRKRCTGCIPGGDHHVDVGVPTVRPKGDVDHRKVARDAVALCDAGERRAVLCLAQERTQEG